MAAAVNQYHGTFTGDGTLNSLTVTNLTIVSSWSVLSFWVSTGVIMYPSGSPSSGTIAGWTVSSGSLYPQ